MEEALFKDSSSTFYSSSNFFPLEIREDVVKLYSFVRLADDFVDSLPQDKKAFFRLKHAWNNYVKSDETTATGNDPVAKVVINMGYLVEKYGFEREWVGSFLAAMEADLTIKTYNSLEDSLSYVYGSGEVIGQMMAKIMNLPKESIHSAGLQGRAFQWINFIRDIAEDNSLGRCYFPQDELKKFKLPDLSQKVAASQPDDFAKFVHFQLDCYKVWQHEAETGYKYIPKKLLVPIKIADESYNSLANRIHKDPISVYY